MLRVILDDAIVLSGWHRISEWGRGMQPSGHCPKEVWRSTSFGEQEERERERLLNLTVCHFFLLFFVSMKISINLKLNWQRELG